MGGNGYPRSVQALHPGGPGNDGGRGGAWLHHGADIRFLRRGIDGLDRRDRGEASQSRPRPSRPERAQGSRCRSSGLPEGQIQRSGLPERRRGEKREGGQYTYARERGRHPDQPTNPARRAKTRSIQPCTGAGDATLIIMRKNTMKHSLLRLFGAFVLVLGVAVTSGAAYAQSASSSDYPRKPIRLVVPFAPGGPVDIVARAIAPKMSQIMGQQIIVDNRGGAGSTIGTEMAANAPPDGYILVLVSGSYVMNPAMVKKLPYDSVEDFAPISIIADVPSALIEMGAKS